MGTPFVFGFPQLAV